VQECTTPDPKIFEGLFVLELLGRPGLVTEKDVVDLEEKIKVVYACNEAGGYYDLVNVTVRLDLVEDQLEGSPETSSFFWLVSIEGLTNLVDLEDHLFDYPNYEQLSDDHPRQVLEDQGVFLRRNIQECA
jgi:hypothetical protein